MRCLGSVKELGEIIRTARRSQGLTQLDLAGLSNVGVTFISKLENGKETSEVGKVLQVLATLGIDLYVEERA